MKQAISILILFAFVNAANAQQTSETVLAKPIAFDRLFWLSSPMKSRQVFIAEIQDSSNSLVKIVYFPKTDGLRGGVTEFVIPKTLNKDTVWKLKLHTPSEEEKRSCLTDNYLKSSSKNKIHTNESGEPTLRFRATQMDADIRFNNLSEMPCMILDSMPQIAN